jgi:putative transposase
MAATQDEMLIETALRMALLGRHPSAGVLFHSNRGSQYTSETYRAVLVQAGITVYLSRTGNCYNNAVTESFFGINPTLESVGVLLKLKFQHSVR